MSRLGDLIKQERARRGLTAQEVAKKNGVTAKYLLEVEAGTRIIRDDQARRILRNMGLQDPGQSDMTLDDIAATVDLESAMPQARQAVKREAKRQGKPEGEAGIAGSIWLDALGDVLKRVPVYNAVMHEVGSRLLPVKDGRVEGAPKDKVYYFMAPDDQMRGFRVHRGDLVLVVPAHGPEDNTLALLDTPQGKALRMLKLLPRGQVMLQTFDQAFESEILPMEQVKVAGKCVRLEAEL